MATCFYTQEQRGDDEIVACYNLSTGEPVWRHRDAARFWESNAGAGPRGTPTISNGRVYTFGATGILNALDARNGAVVWSRNAASDTGVKVPYWGFASSPLVVDDLVIVAVAGQLAAYDLATGEPRWTGPAHGGGYSSPHRLTIDGVPQILLLSGTGATSVAPADGALLWEHAWPGFASLQPARTADGDVLIAASGTDRRTRSAPPRGRPRPRRLDRRPSAGPRPGSSLTSTISSFTTAMPTASMAASCRASTSPTASASGRADATATASSCCWPTRTCCWCCRTKGNWRWSGRLPDEFKELARFPAIEGKTWNHPVLAGDILLVRNGQEMAAFRLSLADE